MFEDFTLYFTFLQTCKKNIIDGQLSYLIYGFGWYTNILGEWNLVTNFQNINSLGISAL